MLRSLIKWIVFVQLLDDLGLGLEELYAELLYRLAKCIFIYCSPNKPGVTKDS